MRKRCGGARSGGFTLIEVLVALLILLVGLLGVAGMQMLSLQQTNNANLRSQVSLHAQNVLERVRANNNRALSAAEQSAWEGALVRDIPSAAATIVFGAKGASVTITWTERQFGNSEAPQTLKLESRLTK